MSTVNDRSPQTYGNICYCFQLTLITTNNYNIIISQQLLNVVSLGTIVEDESVAASSTIAIVSTSDINIEAIDNTIEPEAVPNTEPDHLLIIESNDSVVNPSSDDTNLPTNVEPSVLVHNVDSNEMWCFFSEAIGY